MTDQISDMLIRIKNAYMAKRKDVIVSSSKMNESLAQVLLESKYITNVEKAQADNHPALKLTLNYVGDQPAMTQVKRISKPGRRMYVSVSEIPVVLQGFGINILSTSKGVMSGSSAKEKGVGGELLCEIW